MKKINLDQVKSIKKEKTTHKFPAKKSFSRTGFRLGSFLTATFTAVLIGLFLGVIMLNIFTNKENHASTDNNQHMIGHQDTDDIDQTETNPTTLKQMNAYVLQLGVFSEIENANDWSKIYQKAGFSSIHFLRDNQYFLFAGIAESEEKAKELATILLKDEIEVYVKEWITNEIEIGLTGEESQWFTSFQEQWQTSLKSLEKQEGFPLGGWNQLIESYPVKSEKVTQLVEVIELLSENDTGNKFELQNQLLNIWKVYEETVYE